MAEILQVEHLSKNFGGFQAVLDLSFHLFADEVLGLVGPNGAGKTTTFNLISGFLKPSSGKIVYQGTEITKLSPHQRAALGVVRTFQQTKVFMNLTVEENIRIGFHLNRHEHLGSSSFGTAGGGPVDQILSFAELDNVRTRTAGDLAYGDQRTLGIAIALGAQPKLLLLDEPFAGMNPAEASRCMDLIHRIRESGAAVLLVDHHMDTMVAHCDRLVVMHYGEKLAEGEPETVTQDPRVIEVYLGGEDGLTFELELPVREESEAN